MQIATMPEPTPPGALIVKEYPLKTGAVLFPESCNSEQLFLHDMGHRTRSKRVADAGLQACGSHFYTGHPHKCEGMFAMLLQTAEIIKTAAKKPAERMGWIEACINQHANLPNDPTLAAFQMRVEGRMVDVKGRHLPPPGLQYGGNQVVRCSTQPNLLDLGERGDAHPSWSLCRIHVRQANLNV